MEKQIVLKKFELKKKKKQGRNLDLRNREEIWNQEIDKKFGIRKQKKKGRNLD